MTSFHMYLSVLSFIYNEEKVEQLIIIITIFYVKINTSQLILIIVQPYIKSFHSPKWSHIFFSFSSMKWIISMNRWITLSVPNIIVIQLFIEIIHLIDERDFFFFSLLINELLLYWNRNNNSFINKETFFLNLLFFQPVGWLSLLSDTEKLIFLLLKCKNMPSRSFWRYMYVYIRTCIGDLIGGHGPICMDEQGREFLCTRARIFLSLKTVLFV
jgi:hypothetical protein